MISFVYMNHHKYSTDVAELVLKKCTITKSKECLQPGSKKYSVTFNYEFIEDKDHAKMCVLSRGFI